MPHVCDVEYRISEAFSFSPRDRENTPRLFDAKTMLMLPIYAIKEAFSSIRYYISKRR